MTQDVAIKPYVLVEPQGAYSELLRLAFDQICNKDDWKAPIDCMVPWDAASIYMQAIAFMTATTATCVRVERDGHLWARLTSIGYRNGPAGG